METDSALLRKEQGSSKCTDRRKNIRDFSSSQAEESSKSKCSLGLNKFLVQSADKIQLNQL